jgi:hypothetical protein
MKGWCGSFWINRLEDHSAATVMLASAGLLTAGKCVVKVITAGSSIQLDSAGLDARARFDRSVVLY